MQIGRCNLRSCAAEIILPIICHCIDQYLECTPVAGYSSSDAWDQIPRLNSNVSSRSFVVLREATGATEPDLDWLRELATPRRHGAPIDEPEEQRARALRISRQVVENHCLASDQANKSNESEASEMAS